MCPLRCVHFLVHCHCLSFNRWVSVYIVCNNLSVGAWVIGNTHQCTTQPLDGMKPNPNSLSFRWVFFFFFSHPPPRINPYPIPLNYPSLLPNQPFYSYIFSPFLTSFVFSYSSFMFLESLFFLYLLDNLFSFFFPWKLILLLLFFLFLFIL